MACGLQLKCLGLRGEDRGKMGREKKKEEEEERERRGKGLHSGELYQDELSLCTFPSTGLSLICPSVYLHAVIGYGSFKNPKNSVFSCRVHWHRFFQLSKCNVLRNVPANLDLGTHVFSRTYAPKTLSSFRHINEMQPGLRMWWKAGGWKM